MTIFTSALQWSGGGALWRLDSLLITCFATKRLFLVLKRTTVKNRLGQTLLLDIYIVKVYFHIEGSDSKPNVHGVISFFWLLWPCGCLWIFPITCFSFFRNPTNANDDCAASKWHRNGVTDHSRLNDQTTTWGSTHSKALATRGPAVPFGAHQWFHGWSPSGPRWDHLNCGSKASPGSKRAIRAQMGPIGRRYPPSELWMQPLLSSSRVKTVVLFL